jgi:hypothetical protein
MSDLSIARVSGHGLILGVLFEWSFKMVWKDLRQVFLNAWTFRVLEVWAIIGVLYLGQILAILAATRRPGGQSVALAGQNIPERRTL